MKQYKTIHKELAINLGTLKAHGSYVDFIHLHDEKISIRLIVKPEKEQAQKGGNLIRSALK